MIAKLFRGLILPVAMAIVMLVSVLVVLPRAAVAQQTGPGVDEIIFLVVPQAQAVQAIANEDIDVYIFTLDNPDDKLAARANADVDTYEAPAGYNDMLMNPIPHAAGVGGINPFQFREVREAMNWAFDRDFVINEIYGGFAIPMVGAHFRTTPDWVREAGYFAALEQEYSYNPQRAFDQIDARLSTVSGVTFDSGTEKWMYEGAPIRVKIVQRVEDLRFDIGAYVATELNDLGFTAVLDPSTGAEAFAKVYSGDPEAGVWHVYTEGWLSGGIIQYDDTAGDFFYNGDFGSSWWDFYDVDPVLQASCHGLALAEYISLAERSELYQTCQTMGMQQGIRVFLLASLDMSLAHTSVSGISFDVGSAFNNWWGLKGAMKDGTPGGTLRVGQPIHTITGWNPISGFTWIYEEYQRKHFSDMCTPLDPRLGTPVPQRATFEVDTAGPIGTLDVPEDALVWNRTSNAWEAVGPGVEAVSITTAGYIFDDWHHGEAQNMNDVMVSLADHFRYYDGDLSVSSPSYSSGFAEFFYTDIFVAVEFDAANDTATYYSNDWNFDEGIIASDIIWCGGVPWEVQTLIAKNAMDGDTAVHEDDAADLGIPMTDLVKGPSLPLLAADLDTLKAVNAKPPGAPISDAEATARWAALDDWYNNATTSNHFYVSGGPFYIDQVTTDPEGTVLKAFRDGYPFDFPNEFSEYTTIVVADVSLGTPPDVIQTFPAIFGFSTSFEGQVYDRIATSAWLVGDPATGAILFNGPAVRTGPGQFQAVLSSTTTTALVEGSYEITVIVATQDSVIPTFASTSFAVESLQSALLRALGEEIDDRFADIQGTIDDAAASAGDAAAASNQAVQLGNIVLVVAVVAIVVGVAAVVIVVVRRPKP
ncbi:MAG: ABC transporter substrate-binding protein [Candidatus Thermoplasmatota archaeon]|nr:ABC transporter substrate-binding protein [Candidatus Thermoplasmatota archaeon]